MNALHTLNNDDLTINERLIPDELGTDGGDLILGGTDDAIPFILAPLATNATESPSEIPTSETHPQYPVCTTIAILAQEHTTPTRTWTTFPSNLSIIQLCRILNHTNWFLPVDCWI
jgi:hypothetical protein